MALLAEEIVEEWLNRQGYFTIRGIKMGVHEIDLLAVKSRGQGVVECRHIEVQASMRPVSYISRVPKQLQKGGRAANSAKRSDSELVDGVAEWIDKKFRKQTKVDLMKSLWDGPWSEELVLNEVKSEAEVDLIREHRIKVLQLKDIIRDLRDLAGGHFPVPSAAGADFVELIHMGSSAQQSLPADADSTPKPKTRTVDGVIIKDATRRGTGFGIIGGVHPPSKDKSSE